MLFPGSSPKMLASSPGRKSVRSSGNSKCNFSTYMFLDHNLFGQVSTVGGNLVHIVYKSFIDK